jgi:hypothetical protein
MGTVSFEIGDILLSQPDWRKKENVPYFKGDCPRFLDSGIPGPDNFAPSW